MANPFENERCPYCGSPLETGYVVGQHSRLRWSRSLNGLTIFHGTPLVKRRQGWWRSFRVWFGPPSLIAARCVHCRRGLFAFDNHSEEKPYRDSIASLIIGLVILGCSATVFFLAYLVLAHPLGMHHSPIVLTIFGVLLAGLAAPFLLQPFSQGRS